MEKSKNPKILKTLLKEMSDSVEEKSGGQTMCKIGKTIYNVYDTGTVTVQGEKDDDKDEKVNNLIKTIDNLKEE